MNRKIWPLAATTVALVLGMGMGSAWSYFTDTTYATGGLEIQPETTGITEENEAGTKIIRIQNKSKDAPVWVRARVFAADKLGANASGAKWSGSIDGWFTYAEPLPASEEPDKYTETEPLTVNFDLKKAEPNGAETGDETNVIVVYECAPVSYDADGTVAPAVWAN